MSTFIRILQKILKWWKQCSNVFQNLKFKMLNIIFYSKFLIWNLLNMHRTFHKLAAFCSFSEHISEFDAFCIRLRVYIHFSYWSRSVHFAHALRANEFQIKIMVFTVQLPQKMHSFWIFLHLPHKKSAIRQFGFANRTLKQTKSLWPFVKYLYV